MKILPPAAGNVQIVPARKRLKDLARAGVLTNAHVLLASSFGMAATTHEVLWEGKPVAYLQEVGEKTSVLPVVTPARFGRNTTQYEFENLLALTH